MEELRRSIELIPDFILEDGICWQFNPPTEWISLLGHGMCIKQKRLDSERTGYITTPAIICIWTNGPFEKLLATIHHELLHNILGKLELKGIGEEEFVSTAVYWARGGID